MKHRTRPGPRTEAFPACAFALLLAVPPVAAVPHTTGPGTVALQQTLDSLRASMEIPGASAAVIYPDGTMWTGTSGIAARGVPVTPEHRFETGSITKAYTAALVLDLVAAGELSLDDTVGRLLPGVEVPGADRITVRQLLRHTSGLHAYTENPAYIPALRESFARRWKPEESLAYMQAPYAAPGQEWHYSNANYQLLGMIVEAVTRRSYAGALLAIAAAGSG